MRLAFRSALVCLVLGVFAGLPVARADAPPAYDLLLRGGTVYDGSGQPGQVVRGAGYTGT